jgi:hypothetical protein
LVANTKSANSGRDVPSLVNVGFEQTRRGVAHGFLVRVATWIAGGPVQQVGLRPKRAQLLLTRGIRQVLKARELL